MTKEEKELLLKDLSARLFYGVECYAPDDEYGENGILYSIAPFEKDEPNVWIEYPTGNILSLFISEVKPYLRPMSSMTEEEKKEWHNTFDSVYDYVPEADDYDDNWHEEPGIESYDYLIAHHFDYRGLIPKGLALEATEDMYKI